MFLLIILEVNKSPELRRINYLFVFLLLCFLNTYSDTLVLISAFGSFQEASSISSSREQFIFVTDMAANLIYKFDTNGVLLTSFGGAGFSNNEFNQPICIDASNGLDVFVCDYRNNRIQRYDLKLSYISSFDFNSYNLTSDISKKIYYPQSFTSLPSSEVFVICDAVSYKIVKLKTLDEPMLFFGSSTGGMDRLINPVKIIRGSQLDIWVLDKGSDEVLNFDNNGAFKKRIKNPGEQEAISIAFYGNLLFWVLNERIYIYNVNTGKFERKYEFFLSTDEKLIDINVLSSQNILLLSQKKVYNYRKLNN
jgi:hypothetical protein